MPASPRSLGLSPERLQRIDRFLQRKYIDTGRLPCAQFVVHRRGELAHQSVLGLADKERGVPLAENAIFRIYSMTKPITSVAFMMLVEEGLVALDDPVHRYIPEWEGMGVYGTGLPGAWITRAPAAPMRCVDLLRHTSGLTYGFQNRTNVDHAYRTAKINDFQTPGGLKQMMADLATIPLEFAPGTSWNYSVSTDVLGYLVEVISGQPFDAFLQERIFGPLGMVDTGFHVPEAQAHRLPACYTLDAAGKVVLQDDPATSPYLRKPPLLSGGGGLVSTAADYLRFTRMLLGGGQLDGARILSPKTLRLMTLNHLPGGRQLTELSQSLFSEAAYEGLGFGLGFAVSIDLARTLNNGSLGEFFWGGMASTAFWVDPVEDLTAVFMTQLIPSSAYPIRRELRTLVYAAVED
jgi:CubicO group peptidase (beta-lactamase class C family)